MPLHGDVCSLYALLEVVNEGLQGHDVGRVILGRLVDLLVRIGH